MSWIVRISPEGLLSFQVSNFPSLVIGLYIEDPETQTAIRSRDSKVLDTLNLALDNYEEVAAINDFADGCWVEWALRTEQPNLGYRAKLILQGKYANDLDRKRAQEVLDALGQKRRKYKEQALRRMLVTERRRIFQKRQPQLMLALIERDGCQCKQCGSQDDLTVDHIIPLSKGGSDDLDNLQLLCQSCNSQKRDRLR